MTKAAPKKQSKQARYMARKRKEWKEAGLCVNDGNETGGQRRCRKCTEAMTVYMARRRADTKAAK